MIDVNKRARELLADAYDHTGMHTRAACLRGTCGPLDMHDKAALSAVVAALTARDVELRELAEKWGCEIDTAKSEGLDEYGDGVILCRDELLALIEKDK